MDIKKLSNIELYYSPSSHKNKNFNKIEGDEFNHIVKVMRHNPGDELYVTDGKGKIYKTSIMKISADSIETSIIQTYEFDNANENIFFCIPKLKSSDRLESALEKCTELGITNFIVFDSERTISKGNKAERWEKIAVSAMKQSLRSFLPEIIYGKSLKEIAAMEGEKILFVQEAGQIFNQSAIKKRNKNYFIFGPEGDFTEDEKKMFDYKDFYNLGNHRLRSETAIIKCASIVS